MAEWVDQLEAGKLPPDFELTEDLLKKMGVPRRRSAQVLTVLQSHNVETWGVMVGIKSEGELVEYAGDKLMGNALWDFLESYRQRSKALSAPKPPPAPNPKSPPDEVIESLLKEMVLKNEAKLEIVQGNNRHAAKFAPAKVPARPGDEFEPAMLLHCLGDASYEDRVQDLTEKNSNNLAVLFGPSGSGKTRLLFELLQRHYGGYITFKSFGSPLSTKWGSGALDTVFENLKSVYILDEDKLFGASGSAPDQAMFASRSQYATFAISCVVLAYSAIFRKLKEVHAGITPEQWLLIQLFPQHYLGFDRFQSLALALFRSCDIVAVSNLVKQMRQIRYWALDHANVCVKDEYTKEFFMSSNIRSDSLGDRSFLTPAVAGLREATGRSPIISGTGLGLLQMEKSVSSQMCVSDPLRDICFVDFPRLSVDQVQAFLTDLIEGAPYEIDMAARWLTGRPRFTTDFAVTLWEKASDSTKAHMSVEDVLKEYVDEMTVVKKKKSTGEEPRTPAEALERLRDYAPQSQAAPKKASAFQTEASEEEREEVDRRPDESDPSLYHRVIRAYLFIEYGDAECTLLEAADPLVEIGLAYPDDSDLLKKCVLYPEPLFLQAARNQRGDWFHKRRLVDTANSSSALGIEFEYLVAAQVVPKLVEREFASNPLIGIKDIPPLLSGEWTLAGPMFGRVAECPGADGHAFYDWMKRALDVSAWNEPVPPLGMMLPTKHTGPDIVAVLLKRDPESKKVTSLALTCVQVKLEQSTDGESAMRTVDPELFNYTSRDKTPQPIKKYAAEQQQFLERIANIPVVRVLLSGVAKARNVKPGVTKRGNMEDLCVILEGNSTAELVGCEMHVERMKFIYCSYQHAMHLKFAPQLV